MNRLEMDTLAQRVTNQLHGMKLDDITDQVLKEVRNALA